MWIVNMATRTTFSILAVLISVFLYFYLDAHVPEPFPQKFKLKIMDAFMKTYVHLISGMTSLGLIEYFSPADRKIADWFILTMTTGFPWGSGVDSRLQITDTKIRDVRVKIYQPANSLGKKNRPVLVYFHGGGWSLLSADCYDPIMRKISRESEVVVISVDYRLSPQHPFPVPLNDCFDVVEYVLDNSDTLGVDSSRVAIGGDSAGGNMAAAISLRLQRRIALQLVLVPVLQIINWQTTGFMENVLYLNKSINSPNSLVFLTNYLNLSPEYAHQFLINNHTSPEFKKSKYFDSVDQKKWMPKKYVRTKDLWENIEYKKDFGNAELFKKVEGYLKEPLISPLIADDETLLGLPFTYIMTCGYDFIRDDGIMFHEKLKYLNVKTELAHYPEGFHNALMFPHGPLKMDIGVKIIADIVRILKNKL
ncbi:arylacetamide deacetylase-like isoform X1 [Mytilus californianus]|uniref:arylacetamide deacetylase-like isoform X1 n=1 Tax=Mytilus californianus TaxID=6549 RepID=UPI002246769F|nr:arylacetamide deacetylase-like isoform X1 [Mytilus californianus]